MGVRKNGRNGTRSVRIEDVARAAGVSPITVSRALSAPDKVRKETRERVAEAVASTGYVVNSIAATLRSGQSATVSVFVANLQNSHIAAEVQGIVDAFQNSPYHLMFTQTGWSGEPTAEIIRSILPFRPAGMVLAGVGDDDATRQLLVGLDIPIVEMGERPEPVDMLVQISSFEAGRLMGEHFGEMGFSRIAFCGHTIGHGARRLAGFRAALSNHGRAPALILSIEGTQLIADGVGSVERILAQLPDCDAVFYGSDLLAMGALIEARRMGLDVPGKLAVAGYGDLDFARHLDPPLTTIRVLDYEIGRIAGDMLRKRLEGRALAQTFIDLPIDLQLRSSTRLEAQA
jgi:LacI family gluconate utilization system Gnt-I transcriptional repressor